MAGPFRSVRDSQCEPSISCDALRRPQDRVWGGQQRASPGAAAGRPGLPPARWESSAHHRRWKRAPQRTRGAAVGAGPAGSWPVRACSTGLAAWRCFDGKQERRPVGGRDGSSRGFRIGQPISLRCALARLRPRRAPRPCIASASWILSRCSHPLLHGSRALVPPAVCLLVEQARGIAPCQHRRVSAAAACRRLDYSRARRSSRSHKSACGLSVVGGRGSARNKAATTEWVRCAAASQQRRRINRGVQQ